MHVDRTRPPHDAVDHRPADQLAPPRSSAGAEHDLGGVLRAGEIDEGRGDVVARHPAVLAAQLLEQVALGRHHGGVGLARAGRQAAVGDDVHADQVALGPRRHPRRPPHEVVGVGRAGEGDDDALARLPRPGDAVALAVVLQGLVDLVGDPQQGQLAQRREVPRPEVVAQRGVDLVRSVDVAVGEPAAQRRRRHVDELDLVGGPGDVVGDRLALVDAGDPLDDVVERLEVLDVDRRDHVDAGGQQVVDVLPALLVRRAGGVGVGQLVDEREVRTSTEHGCGVHLGQRRRAAVGHGPARDHLQIADLLGRVGPPVRLDEPDDDVRAPLVAAATLVEHGERLADTRRRAEVQAQCAAPLLAGLGHALIVSPPRHRGRSCQPLNLVYVSVTGRITWRTSPARRWWLMAAYSSDVITSTNAWRSGYCTSTA